MRWFKVAAIAAGVLLAFLVVSSVIGFFMEAALAVAAIILAVKVAFSRKQVSRKRPDGAVREPAYSSQLPRYDTRDVDAELARLKRELRG